MPSGISPHDATRGILVPAAGLRRFELRRRAPSPDLAAFVDWHWIIVWSLPEPFEQAVLPHPCVNVVFEARGSAVHGIGTKVDVQRLEGDGRVVAVKLKPGGWYPFSHVPMRELVDRSVPVAEALGERAAAVDRAVQAESDDARAVALVEDLLRARDPEPEAGLAEAMALAARAQTDREIRRAEDLARVAGVSVRTLHRSFERYVGVGPKWIIRRSRVQEAAERVAKGERVAWAELAQELGYHDQAHFIRDFKAQIGATPTAYAERCAAAARAATGAHD